MNNPITEAITEAITGRAPAHTITVTWANGTRATYSADMLDMLKTDPAALDIQDDATGELVYIKPDDAPAAEAEQQPTETDAVTLAPAEAASVWTEDGETVEPTKTENAPQAATQAAQEPATEPARRSWKARHIKAMQALFGANYERWSNLRAYDDRRVFVIIYDSIMAALNSLPDEPNIYVAVAMNHRMQEDRATLNAIRETFKGR